MICNAGIHEKNDDKGRKSNFEGWLFKMIYQASQHSNHTILKDVR